MNKRSRETCESGTEDDSYVRGSKRQEYTEELYKKDLHDPDNHDNVITNLEPDILKCEDWLGAF